MKLVKLSASWCQPCKALSQTLESLKELDVVKNIEEYDIDETPDAVNKYQIRGVPTLILFSDDGTELKRVSGSLSKDRLVEFLK